MIPTSTPRIPKKIKKKIKQLLDTGNKEDFEKATLMLLYVTRNPDFDLVAIMAIAKASEMYRTLGVRKLEELAKNAVIRTTPLSYLVRESMRFAQKHTKIQLSRSDHYRLEMSMIKTFADMMGVKE